MFGLNIPSITPLAIKVSVRLLAIASLLSLASSATAEPKDLFATDTVAGSILAFATDGTATTFASGLVDPQGIAVDDVGNVFVCESTSGELLKFTPDGTMPGPWKVIYHRILPSAPTLSSWSGHHARAKCKVSRKLIARNSLPKNSPARKSSPRKLHSSIVSSPRWISAAFPTQTASAAREADRDPHRQRRRRLRGREACRAFPESSGSNA